MGPAEGEPSAQYTGSDAVRARARIDAEAREAPKTLHLRVFAAPRYAAETLDWIDRPTRTRGELFRGGVMGAERECAAIQKLSR